MIRKVRNTIFAGLAVLIVLGFMVGSCGVSAKEEFDKSGSQNWPGSLDGKVSLSPVPEVKAAPALLPLEGNTLPAIPACEAGQSKNDQRTLELWTQQSDGIWREESVCRFMRGKTVLGSVGLSVDDEWNKAKLAALPGATQPSKGVWYRIGLLQGDGSIEFVWAAEQQVRAGEVSDGGVVRP